MRSYYQRDFFLHKFGIKYGDIMHKSNVSRRLTLLFYYATLSQVKFMDKDSEKNSANSDDEIIEKELSEMDVKKIMIFRQIGAKIAYYRTLRQMTQAELAKRANALNAASTTRAFPFLHCLTSLKVYALN